jgi:GxxExxY protein
MPPTQGAHYDDITHKIIGAARTVHHRIGPGYKERLYLDMLSEKIAALGLPVEAEKAIEVTVDGRARGVLYPDLVVNGVVVVECKVDAQWLTDVEVIQLLTYLAVTGLPVGLLLNFGRRRLESRRVLPPKRPDEWVRHVAPHIRRRKW